MDVNDIKLNNIVRFKYNDDNIVLPETPGTSSFVEAVIVSILYRKNNISGNFYIDGFLSVFNEKTIPDLVHSELDTISSDWAYLNKALKTSKYHKFVEVCNDGTVKFHNDDYYYHCIPTIHVLAVNHHYGRYCLFDDCFIYDIIDPGSKEEIVVVRKPFHEDGSKCKKCGSWEQMAESNQSDGTFVCYLCLQNPYRASGLGWV